MSFGGMRVVSLDKNGGGINLCCCRICTCVNFSFMWSKLGLLKAIEIGLASMCETLLIQYGLPYADNIGQALISFLTTTACCFSTTVILTICYLMSERSVNHIRQSLFEALFNGFAAFMYASASSYMGFACLVWLHPQFLIRPGFWAYPAMTAVYVSIFLCDKDINFIIFGLQYLGYVASITHGADAWMAWRQYRGVR